MTEKITITKEQFDEAVMKSLDACMEDARKPDAKNLPFIIGLVSSMFAGDLRHRLFDDDEEEV